MPKRKDGYFGFSINDTFYRRIVFKRFTKRENAERYAYRPYRGTAQSDYDSVVMKSVSELEAWAKECNYEIDWENGLLIYKGE